MGKFLSNNLITFKHFISFQMEPVSKSFNIDKHHLFMIFRFCAAVLSRVASAFSLKVTSKCQYMVSTDQCSLTVLAGCLYNISFLLPVSLPALLSYISSQCSLSLSSSFFPASTEHCHIGSIPLFLFGNGIFLW